jgi:hypothetical protein
VQRDWGDDQIGMIIRQIPNQLPCDDAGQTNFSAIFQPKHNLRRYIIIFHGGADAVMLGWIRNARRATGIIATVKFKRRCASAAPRRPQKF